MGFMGWFLTRKWGNLAYKLRKEFGLRKGLVNSIGSTFLGGMGPKTKFRISPFVIRVKSWVQKGFARFSRRNEQKPNSFRLKRPPIWKLYKTRLGIVDLG